MRYYLSNQDYRESKKLLHNHGIRQRRRIIFLYRFKEKT
jgi:hypothetical protein